MKTLTTVLIVRLWGKFPHSKSAFLYTPDVIPSRGENLDSRVARSETRDTASLTRETSWDLAIAAWPGPTSGISCFWARWNSVRSSTRVRRLRGRLVRGGSVETDLATGDTIRASDGGVSAAMAAADAVSAVNSGVPGSVSQVRFPGEDGARSLADMAYCDLDAALQLLAFRAQYITGASGAAIAIRRAEHNDMLCRASAGSNAPELGALLSTESGLSGESVRTRSALRCDDAERDPRVNRDGCRELGIASVAVMPIISDDRVLGVFELFSGTAGAFGERDLSALQRLSEMVETAVKLAEAAQSLASTKILPALPSDDSADDDILSVDEVEGGTAEALESTIEVVMPDMAVAGVDVADAWAPESIARDFVTPELVKPDMVTPSVVDSGVMAGDDVVAAPPTPVSLPTEVAPQPPQTKKPLFWSAALAATEAQKTPPVDQSHVPPVLRNLRKCWACGFPVSEGRKLCVECEDKQWRGQLRGRTQVVVEKAAVSWEGVESPRAGFSGQTLSNQSPSMSKPIVPSQTLAAAAGAPHVLPSRAEVLGLGKIEPETSSFATLATVAPSSSVPVSAPLRDEAPRVKSFESAPPLPVFSAGIGSSESWLSSNKYIVLAILAVAAVVAAIVWLR